MNEVTAILSAIEQGDPQVAEQLLPLVYQELRALAARKLAQEKPGQTLQATARNWPSCVCSPACRSKRPARCCGSRGPRPFGTGPTRGPG